MAIAKEMFLSRPYTQVVIDEIALAADMSKATLYKYFRSKLDIYSAIILEDAQQLVDRIEAAFDPQQDVGSNLRAMAHAYMSFFFEHPEYFQKLSWFYLPGRDRHLSPAVAKDVNRRMESARAAIVKCLDHFMRIGQLRHLDAKPTADVTYSQWCGLAYLALARGTPHKPRADYGKLTDMACQLQLEGMMSGAGEVTDGVDPRVESSMPKALRKPAGKSRELVRGR